MKLLTTIFRHTDLNLQGKTFSREAVRGIIFREDKLLMIYSPVNRDYKFPGGGVDEGESHHETLRREILEESGATMTEITGEFGKIIEYANEAVEEGYETFMQTSYYYLCEIGGRMGTLSLDDYEEDLGFQPLWVDVNTALDTNRNVLEESTPAPRWTRREVLVLEMLKRKKR